MLNLINVALIAMAQMDGIKSPTAIVKTKPHKIIIGLGFDGLISLFSVSRFVNTRSICVNVAENPAV